MNISRASVICTALLIFLFSSTPVFSSKVLLQNARVYNGDEEITNWFMSEKLDGIRGYWNGKKLLTRKGKVINTPEWFIQNFPPFALDGELWSDRKSYEFIQSAVLDKHPSDSWKKITYNIFEVPYCEGDFSSRLKKAEKWFIENQNDHVKIIPQIICNGKEHLQKFLSMVESKGGEGVIIKDPAQKYHTGRTPHVLKVKNFSDMEGVVTGINQGSGKYKNMMGSLTVKLKNNVFFKIGTGFSDLERKNPPKINSTVTFKYYGFTKNGIPRFASFLHVRKD